MNRRLKILMFLAAALGAGACTLTPQPVPPWEDAHADIFADFPQDSAWDPVEELDTAPDTAADPPHDAPVDTDDVDVLPDVVEDESLDLVEGEAWDVGGEETIDAEEEDAESDEIEEVEDIEEPEEIDEIVEIEEAEEQDGP